MKKQILLLVAFSLILIAQPVKAWGPITHVYIYDELRETSQFQASPYYYTITRNENYYIAGSLVNDMTVMYYYSSGQQYPATHNWQFYQCFLNKATTQQEIALAYGMAMGHLLPDYVAHNFYVPSKIKNFYIPNFPLHPIVEAQFEAVILNRINNGDYPDIYSSQVRNALAIIKDDDVILGKLQSCMSPQLSVDVKTQVNLLSDFLGDPDGFYTKAFVLPNVYNSFAFGNPIVAAVLFALAVVFFYLGRRYDIWIVKWMFTGVAIGAGVFFLIGGLAAVTSEQEFDYWANRVVTEVNQHSDNLNINELKVLDPTGFASLKQADASVVWLWWGLLAAKIAAIFFIIYYKVVRK